MSERPDASSSFPWPPVIFGAAFAIGGIATWKTPLPISAEAGRGFIRLVGIAIIMSGIGVTLAAEWRFFQAGTMTLPTRPTSVIVADGIYRYTRNPMYIGMIIALAGTGLLANSWWFLLALPFAAAAVRKLAVKREERYLERKFGAQYLAYKSRVRRWL